MILGLGIVGMRLQFGAKFPHRIVDLSLVKQIKPPAKMGSFDPGIKYQSA